MQRYVIERRDKTGRLLLDSPQPSEFFGVGAFRGMTDDAIAKVVWRHAPDAMLTGMNLFRWASFVHPEFIMRPKTW